MSLSITRARLSTVGALALLSSLAACVQPGPPPPPPPPGATAPPAAPRPAPINYVTTGYVHMRAGPSTNAHIITTLQPGSIVSPSGSTSGHWWQIAYGGTVGFIYSSLLRPQ
jgi:hypothetical protein